MSLQFCHSLLYLAEKNDKSAPLPCSVPLGSLNCFKQKQFQSTNFRLKIRNRNIFYILQDQIYHNRIWTTYFYALRIVLPSFFLDLFVHKLLCQKPAQLWKWKDDFSLYIRELDSFLGVGSRSGRLFISVCRSCIFFLLAGSVFSQVFGKVLLKLSLVILIVTLTVKHLHLLVAVFRGAWFSRISPLHCSFDRKGTGLCCSSINGKNSTTLIFIFIPW